MNTGTIRTAAAAAVGLIFGLACACVQADVTMTSSMSVEGVGAMAFANMSGTTKTVISGDKSRSDSDLKMQSKLVNFFAKNATGPSAEIVLLDQDKLYHLNFNKKEYTETTFEQFREQMQKATDQANSSEDRRQPSAVDQSKCKWLPAKASVNKTGEKAQFGGYDSERVTITATQPCQDTETGSICEVALVLDEWLAPGFAESGEVRKFYAAYAQKMGLDPGNSKDFSERAKLMFSQYKGLWTEVAAKMQGLKGHPVRNSFTLALGGAQCKDSNAQQSQSSQPPSSADNGIRNPNDAAAAVAGKLAGLFHKKQQDDTPAPSAEPAAPVTPVTPVMLPPGDVALMTVTSQLISVSNTAAAADAFTVPADFKKQDIKMN